jgi:hypothetical protein
MSGEPNQYGIGLDKTPANFVALTPPRESIDSDVFLQFMEMFSFIAISSANG